MVGSYIDFGIKTDKRSLDVADMKETARVIKRHKPDIIIHLAAETDVDRCERDPNYAYIINSIGTYNIALAAKEVKAKLVYISTSGIFDGEKGSPYVESDLPNPQNYYGHSKYLGEIVVRTILEDYIVARGCWMFGGGPKKDQKFVAKIISQLQNHEIKALRDAYGSPTFGKDLVKAIKELLLKGKNGVFNLANEGICTRYDVAKTIADVLNPSATVTPVSSDYFDMEAKRGANEAMSSCVKLMRPWKEALTEYLKSEWKPF
jgi:dTDP-4-dehydrorhamnose reductase